MNRSLDSPVKLLNKASLFFIFWWLVYQIMLLYDKHFFMSKFGDDTRFLFNSLNGKFDLSDLYPNSLFVSVAYFFTGSVELSLVLLKLFLLFVCMSIIKILIVEAKVNYRIICLFILSSSDFFFVSSYNMRDAFLILVILLILRKSDKVKTVLLGIVMLIIRPVSAIIVSLKLRSRSIIIIGFIGGIIFLSPVREDALKLFFTPGAYLVGLNYDFDDVVKVRNNQIKESRSRVNSSAFSYILQPAMYLTRPLLFNDYKRTINATNRYEKTEYSVSGFDTDLLFQNIAVIANMIYLPVLLMSMFAAIMKSDKLIWGYLFFLFLFAIVSFGQSRHHLMFSFMELIIIGKYIKNYNASFLVLSCSAFSIIILMLNYLLL